MRDNFLVFGKPFLGKQEVREVVDTLQSGWWGTGPKTEKFEQAFAKYAGSKYALAVNSCTAGLHVAMKALNLGPGDEVITTPLTFCSTANVILHCGATPVFADVSRNDWNIDPLEIEKKITPRTKAIVPVHLHGRPCKMDALMRIARKYKLYIIEDAAHAAEAWYKGKKVGSIGHITVFSFYVTKNIATAEGGMVTTNNKQLYRKMKILSLHGLSHDAYKRYSVKYFKTYQCLYPGFKYNMTDIQASLGLHQLKRVEKNLQKRKKFWDMYNRAFQGLPSLITPSNSQPNTRHAMHLYAILLKLETLTITRNKFIDLLLKNNIGSGVHFLPVHVHAYYRKTFGFKKNDYPNAAFIGERTVSLPLGANLSESDINDVISTVTYLLKNNRKQEK